MRFCVSKGYSVKGSAAIVGNLSQEVGRDLPSGWRLATDHGSQGIAQWRLDRLTALEKFATDNHLIVTDLTTQMLFLIEELSSSYASLDAMLKSGTRSVANLTANFSAIFERPSKQYENLDNRIAQATVCAAAIAADLPTRAPTPEIVLGAGTLGAGAGGVVWYAGGTGVLIALVVTMAVAGLLFLASWMAERKKIKPEVIVEAAQPGLASEEELRAAIGEMKAVQQRVAAATAVFLMERKKSDALLEELHTMGAVYDEEGKPKI